MPPQFVMGSPFLEAAWAVGILLVSVFIAWLIILGMRRIQPRLEKRFKSTPISGLLESLYRPVVLLVVFQGLILGLSSVSYLAPWSTALGTISIAIIIVLATYGLARTGGVLLGWYLHKVKMRQSLIRLVQRFAIILIYIGGLIMLLDHLGQSISPLIAGLGIGGLAIALALQPTLSNFFAGAQVVSDRLVRVGDYIELENSEIKGYVTDIGWRSTRIRTTFNNMLTIPNSRLADSVIWNYYAPHRELAVIVKAGVSYSSDLAHVEDVALTVAREVIQELDEAVKTFEPWFSYEEFGDSNINFWVWLQATDRIASFRVKSEFIKRLHARFNQEGIIINYPVRTTYLEWATGTQPPLSSDIPSSSDAEENR
ncbi:mechanosensitive ion channel family protein [Chloroflexota bacterium]